MTRARTSGDKSVIESCLRAILPGLFVFRYPRLKLIVDRQAQRVLEELRDTPTIICPNHPRQEDGELLFLLSKILDERFHFLVAREFFETYAGMGGFFLEKMKCYPVNRGSTSLKAVRAAREALTGGPSKVVVFPEGEVSYDNDSINQLESGAASMGLGAGATLLENNCPVNVVILPLIISYRWDDPESACHQLAQRLEKSLKVCPAGMDLYERARSMRDLTLDRFETRFDLAPQKQMDNRVDGIVEAALERYCQQLNCRVDEQDDDLRRIHCLQAQIFDLKQSLRFSERHQLEKMEADIFNLIRLRSLNRRVSPHQMGLNSLADIFSILNEVNNGGNASSSLGQTAIMKAARPIELARHVEQYLRNRDVAVKNVTEQLLHSLRSGLHEMRGEEKFLPKSA